MPGAKDPRDVSGFILNHLKETLQAKVKEVSQHLAEPFISKVKAGRMQVADAARGILSGLASEVSDILTTFGPILEGAKSDPRLQHVLETYSKENLEKLLLMATSKYLASKNDTVSSEISNILQGNPQATPPLSKEQGLGGQRGPEWEKPTSKSSEILASEIYSEYEKVYTKQLASVLYPILSMATNRGILDWMLHPEKSGQPWAPLPNNGWPENFPGFLSKLLGDKASFVRKYPGIEQQLQAAISLCYDDPYFVQTYGMPSLQRAIATLHVQAQAQKNPLSKLEVKGAFDALAGMSSRVSLDDLRTLADSEAEKEALKSGKPATPEDKQRHLLQLQQIYMRMAPRLNIPRNTQVLFRVVRDYLFPETSSIAASDPRFLRHVLAEMKLKLVYS
jgi:hypothetical protein